MGDNWECVKEREIAGHTIYLVTREVKGWTQWEIGVDCVTQFRGTRREAESEWRKWVRCLNAIERKRKAKAEAKAQTKAEVAK